MNRYVILFLLPGRGCCHPISKAGVTRFARNLCALGILANPTTVDFVLLLNPAKFIVVLQAFQSVEGALQGWI